MSRHSHARVQRAFNAHAVGVIGALGAALLLASPAIGGMLETAEALELVTTPWFEGIPEDRIAPLSEAAVEALAELLADAQEVERHAAAIELLGRAGGAGARQTILAYSRAPLADELVTNYEHRARLAVPLALGYLARSDDAALAELTAMMRRVDRGWRTERMSRARVDLLQKEMCASGLGISGRAAARAELERMRSNSAGGAPGARWRRTLDDALQVNASRAAIREGALR